MRSSHLSSLLSALMLVACGGAAAETTTTTTTTTTPLETTGTTAVGLSVSGSVSNFGEASLSGGFLPDPHVVSVVSGADASSAVNIDGLGITPENAAGNCTGFATSQPDFILHYDSPAAMLRFFVTAPGDTTLVINDGAGHWWCSDDDGGNLNPMVDVTGAPAGQYDIWVGSYEAGANIQSVLSISELESAHP